MAEIKIIDNEYATLLYYPDTKIVHHAFHKNIGGQEFRDVLNAGTKAFQEYGAVKWLSDDRENSVLSPEDTAWSFTDWFPRTVKTGWKYWALVVPHDNLARMNFQEFIDSCFQLGLRIMVCSDPQEAMEWLLTIDQPA
jgi:hypothetical protein